MTGGIGHTLSRPHFGAWDGAEIPRISTPEEVREHQACSVRRFNEWMLSRGVWVLMTDAEVALLREKISKRPVPPLPPEFPAGP